MGVKKQAPPVPEKKSLLREASWSESMAAAHSSNRNSFIITPKKKAETIIQKQNEKYNVCELDLRLSAAASFSKDSPHSLAARSSEASNIIFVSQNKSRTRPPAAPPLSSKPSKKNLNFPEHANFKSEISISNMRMPKNERLNSDDKVRPSSDTLDMQFNRPPPLPARNSKLLCYLNEVKTHNHQSENLNSSIDAFESYKVIFRKHNPFQFETLDGPTVRSIWLKSGIDAITLAKIW